MSSRMRHILFFVAALGFTPLLLWAVTGLPAFGHYRGPYGDILNRIAVPRRHVTDVVAAVNFDYRGVDTIVEEYMLFAAIAGVAALLRTESDELEVEPAEEDGAPPGRELSEAVTALCLTLVGPSVLLGIYIITHGHLTPGGGFQGGVILAGALVFVYLAGQYKTMKEVSPSPMLDVADALGAGGFVLIGVAGLVAGVAFLQDFLPLGPVGTLYSAGTIPLINLSVGLEVGAGFVLIISEFLRQTLELRARTESKSHEQQPDANQEGGRA